MAGRSGMPAGRGDGMLVITLAMDDGWKDGGCRATVVRPRRRSADGCSRRLLAMRAVAWGIS
jgi:hypothetical protein